jgi:hypothetical protein
LLNHVVPEIVPCCLEDPTQFTSAAGFPLQLDNFSADGYTVNGIATAPGLANVLVSNAKINVVTDIIVLQ